MNLILDAGALVALERGDRTTAGLLRRAFAGARTPKTHGGVVGQVWRKGGARQARLARALAGVEIVPLDDGLGRRAGALLGRARTTDVVDAALVLLATDGDTVLTSDPHDLAALADAAGLYLDVVRV